MLEQISLTVSREIPVVALHSAATIADGTAVIRHPTSVRRLTGVRRVSTAKKPVSPLTAITVKKRRYLHVWAFSCVKNRYEYVPSARNIH